MEVTLLLGVCAEGVWDTQGRGLSYHLGNLLTLGNLTRKLPRKTVVRTGDTAIFWVELDVPEGPVRWLRNQEEMVAGGRVAITAEGTCHTLTIFQCTLEDMGEVAFVAGGCRTTTQFCVSGKRWKNGLWVALLAGTQLRPILPQCCGLPLPVEVRGWQKIVVVGPLL